MVNKWPLAAAGVVLAGINYGMVRMTSYEPKLQRYHITDPMWRAPAPLRIALISDFHGGAGMWSGEALARIVLANGVDLAMVAGDHFDFKHKRDHAQKGLARLAKAVPTFFVSGNNEEILDDRDRLLGDLALAGIHVLDNEAQSLSVHDQEVTVFGLRDRAAYGSEEEWIWAAQQHLRPHEEGEDFRIVLTHRPEGTALYDQLASDLVLAGHAHGGQWQFPLIGGVFAPHQHLFPRYYNGVYRRGRVHPYHLVVGAGLDVHPVVPRICNRPELVLLEVSNGPMS